MGWDFHLAEPKEERSVSMLRMCLVALTSLLLVASGAWAEEYNAVKIAQATGTVVTLTWKDEKKKTKTAVVYVGKSTKGTDAAGKELQGQQLAKILKAGTMVDVTTEKVPATQVGLKIKGDVEVISEIKVVKK
jgi:hypothetical protein